MSSTEIIKSLIESGQIASVLYRGSKSKDEIVALQQSLYELGFDEELNWKRWGADGGYGSASVAAVAAFATKNGISSSGSPVSVEIGDLILKYLDIIDDLRVLKNGALKNDLETKAHYGVKGGVEVVALQTLLNALGYGKQLNWEKWGADGSYGRGTQDALKAFADSKGITADGRSLTPSLTQAILDSLTPKLGGNWFKEEEPVPAKPLEAGLSSREVVEQGRNRVYVSDGSVEVRFTKFKKGVYFVGNQKPIRFLQENPPSLQGLNLTPSTVNVMVAVAENEGNMDAINTWDNSFMTFGMFQWTIGAGTAKGELPALLKKVQESDAALFENYFGQYGLGLVETDGIYGYFTLNGDRVSTPDQKEQLRTIEWSYRFWKSGQDPQIQAIEVAHAQSRIGLFYQAEAYKPKGFYISDLIQSEYGVGLLLDNHVNRPGYIVGCLESALESAGLSEPQSWSTAQEQELITAYLQIRETYGKYPMTDAAKRALVTQKYLKEGKISDERGSFQA